MPEENPNEFREIAFRKIGRNLVNFQRFERMLKLIILRSDLQGYASELAKVQGQKAKDTNHNTLGPLVDEFFETIYSNDSPAEGSPDELNGVWISIYSKIELDEDSNRIRNRKRELSGIVKQRNWLIHSAFADFDFASIEDCKELIARLDEQDYACDGGRERRAVEAIARTSLEEEQLSDAVTKRRQAAALQRSPHSEGHAMRA